MTEERDYHLKKKDFVPGIGWWNYHRLGNKLLIEKGIFNKDYWYHFPRELGLVAYNGSLIGALMIAEAGLEQLVK